ncbi:hypothetical protein K466DRAFT_588925 [Polyporus arcularius HHB13444]|uniref:HNH nuclease domain-containing protein n=1 Tax=Polyporus arcularius HHB13444 TaxID=1314778 RepID=A0A5C3P5B7_9APHY|nr:hypothetical protein K466DRAFT_588925 [Polyporus arcularius HHB13444]
MASANEKFTNLRVAQFLQAYCQMDLRFGLSVDDPRNCLLLSWRAASTFRECRWTLHPTEIPNSYRIKVYGAPSEVFRTTSIKEHVTFSDEKSDPECPIVPPHPDVLRAHAMFTSVLHLSGMVDTIDPTRLEDNSRVVLQTPGHPGDDSSIREEVRGAPSMPGIWSRFVRFPLTR